MRYIFIDKILDLDPGSSIHAQYTWPDNLEIFKDHFPSFPVVPGVLLTEMMGQAGAVCLENADPKFGKAMLIKIQNATFREWVAPGQTVDIFANVKVLRPSIASIQAHASVGETDACKAELVFSWLPLDKVGVSIVLPALDDYFHRKEV